MEKLTPGEDLWAEVMAVKMLAMRAISTASQLLEDSRGIPRSQYIAEILDGGDRDIVRLKIAGVAETRRSLLIEAVRSRYADTVAGIPH